MPDLRSYDMNFRPSSYGTEHGEVEVARLKYCSLSTDDDICVRAHMMDGVFNYSVAYASEAMGEIEPLGFRSSKLPLTLAELINLIDTTTLFSSDDGALGLVLGVVNFNYMEGSRLEDMESFVAVDSRFYRMLGAWYANALHEWSDAILARQREEEEEEELAMAEAQIELDQEAELIRVSPPKTPTEFPAGETVNRLSAVDMALLNKWIKSLPGIQPASISWEPPRYEGYRSAVCWTFRGMSKYRYLFIDWTEDGEVKSMQLGKPYPEVRNAFEQFLKRVGCDED